MANARKYLEIGVNVSLIVVCLCLFTLLIKNYFFSPSNETIKNISIGDNVPIPDFEWEKGKTNVLLFLNSACQYCTKSADFYKQLMAETNDKFDIKLVAVFSGSDLRANEYLTEIGLGNPESRAVSFAKVGINGTPTLAIAGDNGVLSNIWKGKLSPKKENEVRQKLGIPVAEDWYIEESEVSDLQKKGQTVTIIDVREREVYHQKHFADAKNIPIDEISVRAVNELSPSDMIAVYGTFEVDSENAQEILIGEGFSKVYIFEYKFQ